MASWNWPRLINKISADVPFLKTALNALLKMNPTSIEDIPPNAKRLADIAPNQVQFQNYSGTGWETCGKLMHDVDTVDGKHASTGITANTIPVRDSTGKLPGDITGNAATATSAAAVSGVVPVSHGGTGVTTSAELRNIFNVPPTSHKSTQTTYGVGDDDEYGHLKLSDATNSNSGVGGGIAATPNAVRQCVHLSGNETVDGAKVFTSNMTVKNTAPTSVLQHTTFTKGETPSGEALWQFKGTDDTGGTGNDHTLGRVYTAVDTSGNTRTVISAFRNELGQTTAAELTVYCSKDGNTKYVTAPTPVSGANDTKVATTAWVNAAAVHKTGGEETIAGTKTFSSNVRVTKNGPRIEFRNSELTRGTNPSANKAGEIYFYDKDGSQLGLIQQLITTAGRSSTHLYAYKYTADGGTTNAALGVGIEQNGTVYTYAPNPAADSDTTHIATTKWVRSKVDGAIFPAGLVVASAIPSAPAGFLPCNGGAVSRTTYANLFAVLGTRYGAGDGQSTFNLPDMRYRYLIHSNADLFGQKLEEYLPNITGSLSCNLFYCMNPGIGGAFSGSIRYGASEGGNDSSTWNVSFSANSSNGIYGSGNTRLTNVQPKSFCVYFMIKY